MLNGERQIEEWRAFDFVLELLCLSPCIGYVASWSRVYIDSHVCFSFSFVPSPYRSFYFSFAVLFPFISYVSPLFGHVPRAYELWLAVCLASRSSETRKWPRNDSKIIVRPKAEVSVRQEFGEGGAVSSFMDVRYHDDSSIVPASFLSSCWNITEETSDDCHG